MYRILTGNLKYRFYRDGNLLIAAVFALTGLMPILVNLNDKASAATLTSRKVTLTTSQPSATASYRFNFTFSSNAVSQGIRFQFCNDPLGACTKPVGLNVHHDTIAVNATQTFSEPTAFTEVAINTGDCSYGTTGAGGTNTTYCVSRTDIDAETSATKQITLDGIVNPSVTTTDDLYIRIYIYNNNTFTPGSNNVDIVHDGIVAAQIVNQLTVTGRVQERLVFCVFALEDTAGSSATVGTASTQFPTDCTAAEATASTNVDVGVIDNTSVQVTPVDNSVAEGGNDRFGAAMINTNASNGVALTYYPTAAATGTSELRAFRVPGADCTNGGSIVTPETSLLNQCFVSAQNDVDGETITAGTERFGMHIVCVANSNTTTAGTTANLGAGGVGSASNQFKATYANGDTTLTQIQDTAATDNCENTEAGSIYGWHDPAGATDFATADFLIGSNTVVDDELVKFRFAATASPTTPTGTYTVSTTYIATPTY